MPSSSRERYLKRKKLKNTFTVYDNIDESLVKECLDSSCSTEKMDNIFTSIHEHYNMNVSEAEAEAFLIQFKKDFNDEKFNQLISECKNEVIRNIAGPFGLGKVVSAYDKVGGNVDTIHNVREGIYATKEEEDAYANKEKYDSDKYHKDKNYRAINTQHSKERKDGIAEDYMTGEKLDRNKSHDLDHVVSAKEINDDEGRVLAGVDGVTLANTDTNLKPTSATNNRSKKADSMSDFLEKKDKRVESIYTLENKQNRTHEEEHELKKLKELDKIDNEKALKADKEAREVIDKALNKEYYTSTKFAKNMAETSALEGGKMGLQQALGFVISEFFIALFEEIIDIYKNGLDYGFDDKSMLSILTERLSRIGHRIKDKWKDVAVAFKDGAISGFISNLVTTMINIFATTAKRLVRIIREGIFSLFRAIKILLFPPEGTTFSDAMHEAKKVIASGIIISLGVVVEESISTLIKGIPVLGSYADVLTSVLIGSITGISVAVAVHYLDKKKNDKNLINQLICSTEEKYKEFERLISLDLSENISINPIRTVMIAP